VFVRSCSYPDISICIHGTVFQREKLDSLDISKVLDGLFLSYSADRFFIIVYLVFMTFAMEAAGVLDVSIAPT
jgi:hypothetical protein